MAFFHQLRLLLWKNGLGVIRQPGWSLTLIIWPLVIFIILAVTRNQFPPQMKDACYVGPRNLPSTGFFPFLQTLMCSIDSNCHNKSRLVTPQASKTKHSSKSLSLPLKGSPVAHILEKGGFLRSALFKDSNEDPTALLEFLEILSTTHQGKPHNASLMNGVNSTPLGDQEALNAMLESMNLLKRSICTLALPMMNTSSLNAVTFAVVTFCKSNDTLLEVSIITLNKVLTELMLSNPSEMATAVGMAVLVYDQLQNQSSLWESFLTIPQILSPTSLDQALDDTEALLTNLQGAIHVIQKSFPVSGASVSTVHTVLAAGINLIHYVQKWPGRDVSITLGDVVTLQNDSVSEVVRPVLQNVRIPLDKAIGLTLDRDTVRSYLCDNSSNPMWLTVACGTGTVDMLLGWISPDKVAKQALLAWSKHVAPRDVAFAKGLLHSLMGGSGPGGHGGANNTRSRRSVDTQPQNIEEELFLAVGQVVLDILKSVPEVDMVVHSVLRTGFTSMKTANLALDTVEEMMDNVLKDASHLRMTFLTLMTNQSEASVWIGHVLNSVMEIIMMSLTSEEPLTCERLLGPFEWLLPTHTVNIEVWRSVICQNSSTLLQGLLMDWLPLVQKAQEIYSALLGQADYNVTLPMILSEWQMLSNNSLHFGVFLERVATALGGEDWSDWTPENSTYDVTGTLQQSVFLAMVSLGENLEKSQLWPQVKNYFHMVHWIMNYKPGVTTQPANCSVDINTLAILCDTGFNWPQFVQGTAQAVMSLPTSQDVLINCLKGTVNLLQHVYGSIFKHQAASYFQQEIPGGNALSAYLLNLMTNLDGFAQTLTTLNDRDISDLNLVLPLINNLLQSTGLTPLQHLFYSDAPLNVSTVVNVAVKLGRLNQHIFTFNETDPTLPDLEQLIIRFLSMEANLTLPLSLSMGHTLLTYSGYLSPEDVARLKEAIHPFTNQTSAGLVETILSAMELLKTVIDAPNGDPTNIILGYIRQLQEFLVSALRLRRIEQLRLPSGQLSTAQITDLYLVAMDLLKLLTPEGLQNLTQAGPDAAQKVVIQKMLAFLPVEVQQHVASLLQDFQALQNQLSSCTTGQDCVAGVSEIFMFLDQILEMMLAGKGNITITLAAKSSFLGREEYMKMTTTLFSLLLSPQDASYVRTFNQTLHFIRLVMAIPNATVSDVQNALRQSDLTLEELNSIAALAGAANINDLMVNIMEVINVRQCFEPQHAPMVTAQCAMGLINGLSGFLTHLPALRNETAILSLIPVLVNKTITDVAHVDFSSDPHLATIEVLNNTLANIKMSLQLIHLNSPEVMNEIRVVEGLLKLAANPEPFKGLSNNTLMANPQYAQKVYLEIVEWYLKKLENVTSSSSVSELLYPFYRLTEMQVAIQLSQAEVSLFIGNQVEYLMNNLQYPIDGAGVSQIGQTTIKILRHQFEFIKENLEIQNDYFQSIGMEPVFNTTILDATEHQITQYLDLIRDWLRHPNVTLVLTSMLQWGTMNVSNPGADLHLLLQTMGHFLNDEQLAYLSFIDNITQVLNKAIMVAGQPGGLQSDHFSGAVLEAVQSAMQSLTAVTGPLPLAVRQNILGIVRDSLQLIVKPDMSFASSRNISLLILKRAESIVQQIVPKMIADYLLSGIQIATTYFETMSSPGGPDKWNEIILNEMKTIQSLLPPNSTAQAYISVFINITHFILESGQGNMSLWASFESGNLPVIISQMGKLLNTLLPLLTGGSGLQITIPPLEGFADLAHVLEQVMTGKANQDTWNKIEKMLEALLSTLKGTPLWDSIPPVASVLEKVIGAVVNNSQAENVFILSLQMPITTLMADIVHSVNSSHFNLSDVSERMQVAIELTVQAAHQANGTLECSEALTAWEPVREAAGLTKATLDMWCTISLHPVMEAYAAAQIFYDNLNMSHMGVGPASASATAAKIVAAVQSLYQVNVNRSLVTEQLIMVFSSQLSMLAGQPLSPEAQLHWYKQFQDMQLQQSILNEMKTIQSLLPPNSTAQAYISVFINITHFILESGQGNMSLWASFESGNLPVIISQMGKLLNTLLPLLTGGSGLQITIPPLEGFADLAHVLEQVMTGKANQDTWNKIEKMLEALLSTLKGTPLWDSIPPVASVLEKVIGAVVNNSQAENVFILSLQMPITTLMADIVHSVNSSHFNLSDVSERMQVAIELTVQAAHQANGTLECSEALTAWEPVREAAGLTKATLDMWCTISLQPVMEAYAAAQIVYDNLNMSHMGVGPASASAAAAKIVAAVQSLYQVNVNRSLVTEQLIMVFSSQLSMLAGQPLSPEAQLHWYKQFQDMQLQQSLASIKLLSDQLLSMAPALQPYVQSIEKTLHHILNNYQLVQDGSSAQDLFQEAAKIFLTSMNLTSDPFFSMMWGNFSGLNEMSLTQIMKGVVKLIVHMKVFGDVPMVYQAMEQFVASNNTRLLVEKVVELFAWWNSTQASGMDLLTQVLPKICDAFRAFFSILTQMIQDLPASLEQFKDLAENIIAMLRQIASTSDLLAPMDYYLSHLQEQMKGGGPVRRRREAPMMPMREPMDDFIDLFYIDYPALFKAVSVQPTTEELMETAHVFFANPDLGVVMKGATRGMPWGLNVSREETIDAALGVLSYLTLPSLFQMSSMDLLTNAVDMLPEGFPFSSAVKNFIRGLAGESQENLILMQQTIQTAFELFSTSLTDERFTGILSRLTSQVCVLEEMDSVRQLMQLLSVDPGQLCRTLLPSLQILAQSLRNRSELSDALFQTLIGDPGAYDINANWTSVLSEGFGFNTSSLRILNINVTSPGVVKVGEMLRNKTAFVLDVQRHVGIDPHTLNLLMETTLPNNNLVILSWLVNLQHCKNSASLNMNQTEAIIFRTLCSMSPEQWYSFLLLMAQHLNVEKVIYTMVLSEDMQSLVGVMLQMVTFLTDMMSNLLPVVSQLQDYLLSIQDLKLAANPEFHNVMRGQKFSMSSRATFVTLSRALCNNGILAVFGLAKTPIMSESDPSSPNVQQRQEMIEKFKIPRNATPFCMNLYLDMVNTTGGAIAWAFLKPMLMGDVLYTPDTPATRAIMKKSNSTLQEFANLKRYSEDWIEASNYIIKSAKILSDTLPMLQNSLGNSFVKNFIEMQTDINVDNMKETLSNFSNMTTLLEKNKHILKQITTLSSLMVNISSCIKFDRYRGYDSADKLNAEAQHLAKDRNLYASVIFKLPKEEGSSSKSQDNSSFSSSSSSSSSQTTLPPKVSYTIRMHMDNAMRTDRVRDPFFMKDTHISARQTLRYNRGFVYMQESIDRAIIETQTGQRVTEPAVQLQPFPYPCHLRDEYLEAISFVFPLMLMIAWVLFVADFVKKLVHERELRLHEYMKMMGVNPLSHFFAWFLECAVYLVLTIIILTLVMKYGRILPNSDGFLLFLYFCDYSMSILAFSYMVSSFFDKTYIAGLSGSLIYVLCFFPFIVVLALESSLTFSQKSALSLFSPTCFSYASQYISRYESQGEGIQWSNSYISPMAGDTASFGWLCWLMLIDSMLYFVIGAYIRMVFPGKYGIPAPWYFPFKLSFWADLCCCFSSAPSKAGRGLLFTNIMHENQPVFPDDKGKDQNALSSQAGEDFSGLPVGVALHGLTKIYGDRMAIENLNVAFYEGHVTSLLGHNGAGKTTTMSLLTGLFAPSSGTIEVYGRDMQNNIDDVRKELGVCMQYDVHFDHMTTKEHLLLYGQIKAPHWSRRELHEQVRKILEETGMYAHRHKRVGTLSGGMKRKLSISIAFIGGSRLVVLDEPTTGVDPCSRRSIWDIVIQHKRDRTIIMSTHHLDEAEVLSDRIAFLERGGLKCCGSPFHLKDKLGQGYNLTLTKKLQSPDSGERFDSSELKTFIQAHVPEARLKEAQVGDLVYSLPPFTSSNASSYRSLLTALDANLDALQLGCYGISDTTLEEVFLQLTHGNTESEAEDGPLSISETVSDSGSIDSFPEDLNGSISSFDKISLTGSSTVRGLALAWQQFTAILTKRIHHSRRDWKGLISQVLLPVLFVVFAMGLGSIKNDLRHYPEMELSPALYNLGPSYSFFSNQNPNTSRLVDTMMSFPGIDNACLDKPDNPVCTRSTDNWRSSGNRSQSFTACKCTRQEQVCSENSHQPPHKKIPSSQTVYNLSGIDVENYLISTANDFIRNRYGGFVFGKQLPPGLQMDLADVPKNRTLSKIWYNPEGHHTMPAYLNSLNNFILRSSLPADKDPRKYAISVSSHPYFGRADDEDSVVQGMIQILVALCVLTGYAITTASFAIYEVHEHHSGSKRLQHIAGVGEPFYWAVNFFYDMVIYLIPVALTVGMIAAFQIPAFTDRQNLAAVTLLLVLFGFATFPWMYLLSGVFKDAEMAFITYVCINLFISVNTIMSTSILYFLGQIAMRDNEAIQEIFRKLSHAFLIFPQFSFGNGLMELARVNMEVQILSGYGIDAYKNPFSTDTLGWMFISSFLQGLFFFSLRLLLNKWLLRKVRHLIMGRKTVPRVAGEDEDEDVVAEHQRVSSGAASSDVLQVNQLTKVYQHLNKKVQAVKRLSVGIPAGECFGLLGVNGAGKTTTFKMLTGDVSPTDGTAQIKDWDGRMVDIMECRNKGINIGYCPQVDALDDLLTGEEHLYFYARIRGISKREIDGVVNYLVKKLELGYHRSNVTDSYSCGTRRKLSTALALIGHPQILLLDEPSSGMDPRTKRHLWKIISEEVKGKCAVVLTSHSMEECEALCSRLAIMVKGQFRCLGSLQHIKNRFGSGFTVKMYLAMASCDVEAITSFMQRRFPSTYLKDQHSTMVEYHVPVAPGGVADIFDQLESNKTALQIKHFSVSQTTLDEVFINFAMGKIDMETIPIHSEGEECDSLGSIEAVET
uniref:uncharacterized protein abca12 n=1 Tax=Centroberyx gerrardi TaxID=166262 RepID=UPI003AAEC31A